MFVRTFLRLKAAAKLQIKSEKVIIYKEISSKFSQIGEIERLYVESFPSEERREWSSLLQLMDEDERFRVLVAVEDGDGSVAGFITVWTFGPFGYIEHLAVQPQLRGHGIGAQLLAQVNHPETLPLVLEVEPPTGEMERRRIGFYRRAGLELRDDVEYMQPPYAPGKPSIAMCLMASAGVPRALVEDAATTLHREVYGAEE